MARRLGWSDDQIFNLAGFRTRADFTPAEKAALEFAERMTRDANTVDDDVWAELRKRFDEGEVVELAAAIGLFNDFNRLAEALRLEPTR